ncbi:hypothetical protein F5Y04DRAFT_185938 [Hypomontagnella monticulosa]|nr:hypothetical protein F5Y04DRAFT_185938 [Hypomontagnella monticulosa]
MSNWHSQKAQARDELLPYRYNSNNPEAQPFCSPSLEIPSVEGLSRRAHPHIKGWPEAPQAIPRRSLRVILKDASIFVVSLVFLVLAVVILCLKDQPKGNRIGQATEEASKLAPTIFPILFAAVVSRALFLIGRSRAESGIQLGTLRGLVSTKTVTDAVANLFDFHDLLSVILLLLWALSPVGSQASLRALITVNQTTQETVPIRYMDTGPLGQVFTAEWNVAQSDALNGGQPTTLTDVYSAAMMQTLGSKLAPLDAWGNIKIPRLDSFNSVSPDGDGWINTSIPNPEVESYSSLFGIPIAGLPQNGTTFTFSVETSYVSLSCPNSSQISNTHAPVLLQGLNVTCTTCALNTTSNEIGGYPGRRALWSRRSQFFIGEGSPNSTEALNPVFSDANIIQFLSPSPNATVVSVNCSATQVPVETRIRCVQGVCAATHIRPSTTDKRNLNYTVFDYWAKVVLDEMTLASRHGGGGVWPSASELFISNSSREPVLIESVGHIQQQVDLAAVPLPVFAARASMLLNTFIDVWMSGSNFAGEIPTNLSMYGPAHIPATGLAAYENVSLAFGHPNLPATGDIPDTLLETFRRAPFIGASTSGVLTQVQEVYKPDVPWLILLFVAAGTMSAVSLSGVIYGLKARAPDRFDVIMSQTYDNPYFDCPPGGSLLGVKDRAKLLRHVRVRVGNVHPEGEVGKLGFATAENARSVRSANLYE